jgi:zinc transporter
MNKQKHIIFSYAFDSSGKATKLNNEQVALELKNENLAWVHLDGNYNTTKQWLKREVDYLDHIIIDALIAEETRPRIMEFDNGLLIILRAVNLNQNSEPDDMVSIRMWIDSERIITIQRRNMKAVFDIQQNIDGGKEIKNSAEFLYNLLYQILFVTSPFLYAFNEKLDELEDKIMSTHDIELREEILQIRTQSAIFKRYLIPQREVISKLRICDRSWIDDWARRHFQENFDQITHMVEEIESASSRSQILHDELANALSEKLNRNLYKLSLITVIFMPLTFITGLFGMNVGGIPAAENQFGFYICTAAMMIVATIQILFFKKSKWF